MKVDLEKESQEDQRLKELVESDIKERINSLNKELQEKEDNLEKIRKEVLNNEEILKIQEFNLPKEYARFQQELKIRDKQVLTLKSAVEGKTNKTNEIIRIYEDKLNQKAVYIKSLNISFDEKLAQQSVYLEELKRLQVQKDLEISLLQNEKKQFEDLNADMNEKIKNSGTLVIFN